MSWYDSKGFDGVVEEEKRIAKQSGPTRLYLKPNQKRQIVFVDSNPFCVYEHNPNINGSWRNWMTCLRGEEQECPACSILGPRTRYYCGYFTAIDCTPWVDTKGNKHQFELILVGAKLQSLKQLKDKNQTRIAAGSPAGLSGQMYEVNRYTEKSPSIGETFEHVRAEDLSKLFEVTNYRGKKLSALWDAATAANSSSAASDMEVIKALFKLKFNEAGSLIRTVVPFNYMELLSPMPAKDMKAALVGVTRASRSDGAAGIAAEDDIPF